MVHVFNLRSCNMLMVQFIHKFKEYVNPHPWSFPSHTPPLHPSYPHSITCKVTTNHWYAQYSIIKLCTVQPDAFFKTVSNNNVFGDPRCLSLFHISTDCCVLGQWTSRLWELFVLRDTSRMDESHQHQASSAEDQHPARTSDGLGPPGPHGHQTGNYFKWDLVKPVNLQTHLLL